nr:transcription factor FAMA [Ipomoea batatas]
MDEMQKKSQLHGGGDSFIATKFPGLDFAACWSNYVFGSTSLDKLSFADVMQFADFRPKLRLNEAKVSKEETGLDPIYFLKFPVLNEKSLEKKAVGLKRTAPSPLPPCS